MPRHPRETRRPCGPSCSGRDGVDLALPAALVAGPGVIRGLVLLLFFLLTLLAPSASDAQTFMRGDANNDGSQNIADVVFILNHIASLGQAPVVADAADTNDNGVVEVADAVYLLDFFFAAGPPIPPPSASPGTDTTPPTFPPATDPSTVFHWMSATGCAGSTVTVTWLLDSPSVTRGVSCRIEYPTNALTFDAANDDPITALLGSPPDFFIVHQPSVGVVMITMVHNFIMSPSNGCPAGLDLPLAEIEFQISPGSIDGSVATLTFVDGVESGIPITNLAAIDGPPVVPTLLTGSVTTDCSGPEFRRGDTNEDGETSISDAITLIEYLYLGGAASSCLRTGDTNADGALDISDVISLLIALFEGGASPPEPWLACGNDLVPTALPCLDYPAGCP